MADLLINWPLGENKLVKKNKKTMKIAKIWQILKRFLRDIPFK